MRNKLIRLAEKEQEPDAQGAHLADRFTWEMVDLLGAFPAVMDRHITEFFPAMFSQKDAYYGRTLGVNAYSFEETISWGDELFDSMSKLARSSDPLPDDYFDEQVGEHEQVVEIIDAAGCDCRVPLSGWKERSGTHSAGLNGSRTCRNSGQTFSMGGNYRGRSVDL